MTAIPYWYLIRAFLALSIGFWIASRLRGVLRAIVIRAMPVRYRMSEQYFNIQTRISMIAAVAVGLGIASLAYWGIGKAGAAIKGPVISRSTTVEIEPIPSPPPTPPPLKLEAAPADTQATESPIPETYEEPEPVRISAPPAAPLPANSYYLQLHAFLSEARAWERKAYWAGRLPQSIRVGVLPGDGVPYKVLAGPFSTRRQAISFREKNKLAGFPRRQGQIRLYE